MKSTIIAIGLLISFPFLISAQWVSSLPTNVQNQILWVGDHEEGTTFDWTMDSFLYPGGGIFNTGGTEVETEVNSGFAHSGNYGIRATITNACQVQNGSRAVRLMRWTDTAWDDGGQYFPDNTYYSTWMFIPKTYNPNKYAPWDPGDGGWWNVFQFKSNDINGISQPIWSLNITHNDSNGELYFYFYSEENTPSSYSQNTPRPIPIGKWFHLEAFYKASTNSNPNGEVKLWQDGELIIEASNVVTRLDESVVWGLGNYTNHIDGADGCGNATVYFDDCIVATNAIHPYIRGSYRLYLEGAYAVNSGLMRDDLRTKGVLPMEDPYGLSSDLPIAALSVSGSDALVDWVLLELRAANDPSIVVASASGLLQRDGDVVASDGVSPFVLESNQGGLFYVAANHKSHLISMTPSPIGTLEGYDFTRVNSYTNGGVGQKELASGIWGQFSGNSTGDKDLNGQDLVIWATENGNFNLYSSNDYNLDADISSADKIFWSMNNGVFSFVP